MPTWLHEEVVRLADLDGSSSLLGKLLECEDELLRGSATSFYRVLIARKRA